MSKEEQEKDINIDNRIDDLLLQFTKNCGAISVTFTGDAGDESRIFQMPYSTLKIAIKQLISESQQTPSSLNLTNDHYINAIDTRTSLVMNNESPPNPKLIKEVPND